MNTSQSEGKAIEILKNLGLLTLEPLNSEVSIPTLTKEGEIILKFLPAILSEFAFQTDSEIQRGLVSYIAVAQKR